MKTFSFVNKQLLQRDTISGVFQSLKQTNILTIVIIHSVMLS